MLLKLHRTSEVNYFSFDADYITMKVGVFHSSYDIHGGAEVLVWYIGKALGVKVHSFVSSDNKLGFIDISKNLPFIAKVLRRKREFDYLSWSCIDPTDYGDFDIIITSGWTARAIVTPEKVMHVHYTHAPLRLVYDLWHYNRKSKRNWFKREILLPLLSEFYRVWDKAVDCRVDYYFSNSPIIKKRLWKYLKRDSVILYPPIEFDKYKEEESENFYLFIGRLEAPKRPEEAIRACILANRRLKVIGTGSLEDYLRKKYDKYSNIEFLGFVEEDEKLDLLSRCKAVIYPCIAEDFGIVPIEAFASGKPVITDKTGFPPYVVNEERGIITDCSDPKNIAKAIETLEKREYDPEKIREFAKQFDFKVFKEKLWYWLKRWYDEFKQSL